MDDTSRGERGTLWLAGVAHGLAHAWELVFPAVAVPMAVDLGVGFEQVVTIPFLSYLLFGLGAAPAGWAADRFGGRKVLLACLLAGGASSIAVAFASSRPALVLALAGVGLAASLYHPAGLSLIAERFPRAPGRAFAINGIAGNVGQAATPLLAALLAAIFDWRAAFLVVGVPGILAGLWFSFVDRGADEPGRNRPVRPQANVDGPEQTQWRALALVAVAVLAGGLAYRLHTVVLPAVIQERMPGLGGWLAARAPSSLHGVANLVAAALTTAAYSVGIFGQWWGGRAADAMPVTRSYLGFRAAGCLCIAFAAAAAGPLLLPGIVGYVLFNQGMQPSENRLVPSYAPAAYRGRVYAGKFLIGLGGGSLAVFLVPWIARVWDLGTTLVAVALFEAVIVVVAVALARMARARS